MFRNFTLAGKPEVLPEVKLTAGDYLEGWVAEPYGGSTPQRLQVREVAKTGKVTDQWGNSSPAEPEADKVYDWQAKGGELLGRRLDRPTGTPSPSRLAYFRPMRSGESVRYEFFYEPAKTAVHPTLGRLAFLLEPDAARLHWLTDQTTGNWTGLAADNAIDDPAGRKAYKLPLKAGDWNAVALTTTADSVKVELNGSVVYAAKLDPQVERTFGLFHYRDRTAARARNVVLTGPWAKTVAAGDVGFGTATPPAAAAKARRQLLGEKYYATEAGDVVARANNLSPAERYRAFADWVLPTDAGPRSSSPGRSGRSTCSGSWTASRSPPAVG